MKRFPLWRVLPVVFLAAFYWQGFDTWFYQDDFGWLNVRHDIHGWADVLPALFVPKAHGNIRPLSETGFFALFSWLFGVNALPFRVFTILTQMAALVLAGDVVRRLSGSRSAAFWAQIFWAANCGLAVVMCWTSIYNQALCAFFLLLALWCLLRWMETGGRRWWMAQWGAFLLGFGALETMAVYPVLAAACLWPGARKHWRKTLPLFAVSAVYAVVRLVAAPPPGDGVYAMHPGLGMAATFWTYWQMALGPARLAEVRPLAPWIVAGATAVLTAGLLAALRVRGAWFGLVWFAVTLAPYLPMRDHVMDYYLAIPAAGLAMLGGWGVAAAWRSGWRGRTAAAACAALYLGFMLPASHAVVEWHHARSRAVENLVLGVAEIHSGRPDAAILLTGVNTDLFYSAIADVPFRVLEIPHVYLAPGSEAGIRGPAELVGKFVLPEELAARELDAGRAVVYDAAGPLLRNVTSRYRLSAAGWTPETPRFINAGDPIFGPYLGDGWEAARDGYRGMRGRASLRIGGPRTPGERLWVGALSGGRVNLRVRAAGIELQPAAVVRFTGRTDTGYALPAALLGRREMQVTLESGTPLIFGFAEVR